MFGSQTAEHASSTPTVSNSAKFDTMGVELREFDTKGVELRLFDTHGVEQENLAATGAASAPVAACVACSAPKVPNTHRNLSFVRESLTKLD